MENLQKNHNSETDRFNGRIPLSLRLNADDEVYQQSQINELFAIFGRHKLLFAAVSLSLMTVGTGLVAIQPKEYTAKATIMFDPRNKQMVNSAPVIGGFGADSQALEVEIATELQLILSRRVTDTVIDRFNLLNDSEFNGTRTGLFNKIINSIMPATVPSIDTIDPHTRLRDSVLKSFATLLNVQVQGHSTVLQISFTSENPEKATAIANAIATNYVQLSVVDKSAAMNNAIETMTKRSVELRDQTVAADSEVEAFRNSAHLIEGSAGNILSSQITDLNTQLTLAEADLASARSRLLSTERAKDRASVPAVIASQLIQTLQAELAHQTSDLAREQGRGSVDNNPNIKALKAGIINLRERIDLESDNIIRSQLQAVDIANSRVSMLKTKITDTWEEIGNNSAAEINLRQLKLAASVQHSLYESYLRRIQEIIQQVGTAQPYAELISAAELPTQPSSPMRQLLLPAILLVSVALASFSVVCAEIFSKGFRSLNHITQVFGKQAIEFIPCLTRNQRRAGDLINISYGPYSEAIQSLRFQLRNIGSKNKVILFSSSVANEGKTFTAVTFARQEAKSGAKVLLIDADFQRSQFHLIFKGKRQGLAELLLSQQSFDDLVQKDDTSGLFYLSSGEIQSQPIDLLANNKMQELLQYLAERFDRIVIDSPPTITVVDARILTGLADTTLYLVRWNSTPRRFAKLGMDILRQSGGQILGPIFIRVKGRILPYDTKSGHRQGIV